MIFRKPDAADKRRAILRARLINPEVVGEFAPYDVECGGDRDGRIVSPAGLTTQAHRFLPIRRTRTLRVRVPSWPPHPAQTLRRSSRRELGLAGMGSGGRVELQASAAGPSVPPYCRPKNET